LHYGDNVKTCVFLIKITFLDGMRLVLLFWLLSHVALAQTKDIFIGVKGGANFPELRGNGNQYTTSAFTYGYGVSLEYFARHDISIVAEINYSRQGSFFEGLLPVDLKDVSIEVPEGYTTYADGIFINTYEYLELPIMMRISDLQLIRRYREVSLVKYASLGLFGGYLIDAVSYTKTNGNLYLYNSSIRNMYRLENKGRIYEETDVSNDIRKFNFGIVFGGGIGYYFHNCRATIDARFANGLMNIYKVLPSYGARHTFNLSIGVGLSYTFHTHPKDDPFD
jgi:hypothetical protein